MIKKSVTQSNFLSVFEIFVRRIPVLYFLIRNNAKKFNIFEKDFEGLKYIFEKDSINIIDVGASDGISANFFLKELNPKKVWCYEPIQEYCKEIKKLKKKFSNICICNFGISDKEERKTIYYPQISFFGKKLNIYSYIFYNKDNLIKQVNLDFFFKKNLTIIEDHLFLKKFNVINSQIDLIKIDVNGYEDNIILAQIDQIKKDLPLIICEFHEGLQKLNNLMKDLGYKKYYFHKEKFYELKDNNPLNIYYLNEKHIKRLRNKYV